MIEMAAGDTNVGSRPIRVDLIRECWDDIIRLAASIKAGTVAPSVMLKKGDVFGDGDPISTAQLLG